MTRGRKKDLTIPPSRTLVQQRDYRARKAHYIANLEERCRRAEEENIRLRMELDEAKALLTTPALLHPETVEASSELMHNLSVATTSLTKFQRLLRIFNLQTSDLESKRRMKTLRQENPVARLKLLLIASFLTLHILNLITPLTPSRHTSPASASKAGQVNIRKVDITAPGLRSVLNALVEASAADLSGKRDLFVKVSPPIHIKVVVPPSMLSSSPSADRSSSPSYFSSNPSHQRSTSSIFSLILPSTFHSFKSSSELLESFMSSWTRLVGDPILSKLVVVVLAISISLNGYLLKGIASGVVGGRLAESLGVGFGNVARPFLN